MRLLRRPERRREVARSEPPDDPLLLCVICGAPLAGDPDDEPDGEGPGQHLCGECRRAREFDTLRLVLD